MLTSANMKSRPYTQAARADGRRETHRRILDAHIALVAERGALRVPLAEIAEKAGVTVQTVLRHFGSAEGLRAATHDYAQELVRLERAVPVGDAAAAVAAVVAQYEARADAMFVLLAHETTDEGARRLTTGARAAHREWAGRVFADVLAGCAPAAREELVDLLVVATDLQTWRLLRRELGLSPRSTEERMLRLVRAVLADTTPVDGSGGS